MSINHISRIFVQSFNLAEGFLFLRKIAIEIIQLFLHLRSDLIFSFSAESLHEGFCFLWIIPCYSIDKTLQITGNQDVHGRGAGKNKITVTIVFSGGKEIIKHLIFIGCTYQFINGKPHILRIKGRKDIPEITGGHCSINLLARCDLALCQQLCICVYIINNLRYQTSDIDGIGGRELISLICHLLFQILIGKKLFHTCLGIIKIAMNAYNKGIIPFLGDHLFFLDRTHSVLRVKNNNFRSRHICETGQGRLSGISGGRRQNNDILIRVVFLRRCNHKMRQDGQRHIFKGNGLSMEKFQIISPSCFCQRCDHFRIKLAVIRIGDTVLQLFLCKIGQKQLHNLIGHFLVGHGT